MICNECGRESGKVLQTDQLTNENKIQRVRICLACGYSYVTIEYIPDKKERAEKFKA